MTGVHLRAGFTTGDYEEAGIKRADGRGGRNRGNGLGKAQRRVGFAIGELSLASTLIVDGEPRRCATVVQSGVRSSPFSGSAAVAQGLIAA